MIGATNSSAPAAICGHGSPCVLPCSPAKYTGTVTAVVLFSVIAKPYSFHAEIRQNTAVTAIPVRARGNPGLQQPLQLRLDRRRRVRRALHRDEQIVGRGRRERGSAVALRAEQAAVLRRAHGDHRVLDAREALQGLRDPHQENRVVV